MIEQQIETKSRLIAKILREVLASGPFLNLSDLTEALKVRCGRLRIQFTPDDLNGAYRLIASNRDLVTASEPSLVRREIGAERVPETVSKVEASRLYRELMQRYAVKPSSVSAAGSNAPENFPDLVEVSTWR